LKGLRIFGSTSLYLFDYIDIQYYYEYKIIQTLVSEAMQEIKTINADEALKMVEDNNCNLIDIREARELESTGKVENSVHIPRGMLEIYLDPNSALFQQGVLDQNKEMVLFCAGGVRSA
jgi:rhodanese-related sulfurtransferase